VPADLRALTEAIRTLDSSNVIHPAIEQPSPSMQHVPRERGDHA
jgi:hypothetical protein